MTYNEALEESKIFIRTCELCGSENLSRCPFPASGEAKTQIPGFPTTYIRVECEDCKEAGNPSFRGEFQYH